ncbi:MAG: hypothetical protein LW834_10945 [Cyanobium sp. 49614_E6]|jgi:hypothetical protein|nr:hypothetical protein [Cyanobium sp. 49614_E6]
MPNFDGGHYFLTALIPVRQGLTTDPAGTNRILSHVHAIKEVLASLPTENQDPYGSAEANLAEGMLTTAPFSRDLRTHLARMVVIDDVAYNGRQNQDAIRTAILGPNPVLTEAVDHLPWPYLAFISDFDAADGNAATLTTYLRGLWSVMGYELGAIFEHCQGFDPAAGEASFVALIEKGQIETTMSFNDYYWSGQGQGESRLWQGAGGPVSRTREALLPPGLALLALGLLAFWSGLRGGLLLLALLAALSAAIYWLYRRVLSLGFAPFPTAPRSDLPSVLKALYLQRRFIRFMVDQQGQPPEALKAAFADFVAEHRPHDPSAPTQKPATYFS